LKDFVKPFSKLSNDMKTNISTFMLLLMAFLWIGSGTYEAKKGSATSEEIPTEKINKIFEGFDSDKTPGCAVSVFSEGQSVFKNAYGVSNLDYGIMLSDSSSFYMASVSKHFTAAAAGLLIIRGELDDSALVKDYIEDWPEYAEKVTVGQLFSHTSGVPDIYGLMGIAGMSIGDTMELEDYMDVIRNGESLKFEPGTGYSYTNSGYTTLAYLVEIITEESFAEFAEREFFKPFGMTATHFHNDRSRVVPNRVISYQPAGSQQFRRSYLGMFQGVGGGGLYTTLNDWEKWESFWYGSLEWDGGITLQEANELKARMITPALADGESVDYGWGLHISQRKGQKMIGHGGSFMGFRTDYRRYPEQGVSFLTLCNRGDTNPQELNEQLADLFLKDTFEAYLLPFGGTYRNDELPIEYELTVEEANLKLNRRNSPNGFMREDAEDKWRAGSWDFVFERDNNGKIKGFVVSTGRARDVKFSKIR
jgi:CubicO group peptidase (beta-lactamase class C family)